jgi:heme exporter protein D
MEMEYAGFVWSAFGVTGAVALGLGLALVMRLRTARRRYEAAQMVEPGQARKPSRLTVTEGGDA